MKKDGQKNSISIIVAKDLKRGIGFKNTLPWSITEDLKKFKEITTGSTLIMGRKTFESIGRPLPKRNNIVITSNPEKMPNGIIAVSSVDNALEEAENFDCPIFIIGGYRVYKAFIERGLVDTMYVTEIDDEYECDTFFPDFDIEDWKQISFQQGIDSNPDYAFVIFKRKAND